MGATGPIRVLVCDDSPAARGLLARVLSDVPAVELQPMVASGPDALARIRDDRPDLLLLDLQMPGFDGLATLAALRRFDRRLPVIVFSSFVGEGARATFDALARGAHDCVHKPSDARGPSEAIERIRAALVPKVRALTARASRGTPSPELSSPRALRAPRASVVPRSAPRPSRAAFEVLALGASTGGPRALMSLLAALPRPFPVPVLVTQHMPSAVIPVFARRLGAPGAFESAEARHGERLRPDRIYVAPGDHHLTVAGGRVCLDRGPEEHGCRPAVDPMLRSLARAHGAGVLAAVLTGMGTDGADGAEAVRAAGGTVLAQDADSALVYGMPRAVARRGAADAIVALDDMAAEIARLVGARASVAAV
ncbi:MAG TPA: chemotaxis-specific protein-glutamate methyltransferase CheB [Sandaracinaceae bacterium LLY-WYZ-13_1]|nr:chemotaxis-specific protein-glutamate methyltransferase CheB [Sandaracinaceae bacterium LLY-WYZ-13_1]